MRGFQRCLGSLNDLDRRYLTLRAGLGGAPQSRAQAARQLGISGSDARVIERHGMRVLRLACGGSTSGQAIGTAAPRMPQFQSASLLMVTGGSTPLAFVDQSRLSGQQHGVKGVSASSPESEGPGTVQTSVSRPLATASSEGMSAAWIPIVAVLALMTALAMTTVRRGSRRAASEGRSHVSEMTAAAPPLPPAPPLPLPRRAERVVPPPPPPPDAPAEPAAEANPVAEPEPQAASAPTPPAPDAALPPAQSARGRDYRRAAMIASGVASVAARELMRRRHRGRR